jgi:spermidine synthase
MDTNNWIVEHSMKDRYAVGFRKIEKLHEEQSQFQKIEVFQTDIIGKILLLDGKAMISNHDEFVYHEIMAHVSTMVSPQTQKVLVIGGGDGGVVREFCKYPGIEQIDLVEIDERVIEVSKIYFPECTQGLSDPRVTVHHKDGIEFIKNSEDLYDIIIVDSTDPEDFATGLFTKEFYRNVNNRLSDHGIMMNQTENPFLDEYNIRNIYKNMEQAFSVVSSLSAPMLIYPGVFWTFGFASKNISPTVFDERKLPLMRELQKSLKWYNLKWHQAAFSLSNFHQIKCFGKLDDSRTI